MLNLFFCFVSKFHVFFFWIFSFKTFEIIIKTGIDNDTTQIALLGQRLPRFQLACTVLLRHAAFATLIAQQCAPPRRLKAHGDAWPAVQRATTAIDAWRARLDAQTQRLQSALSNAHRAMVTCELPVDESSEVLALAASHAELGDEAGMKNAWQVVRGSYEQTLKTLASACADSARILTNKK